MYATLESTMKQERHPRLHHEGTALLRTQVGFELGIKRLPKIESMLQCTQQVFEEWICLLEEHAISQQIGIFVLN